MPQTHTLISQCRLSLREATRKSKLSFAHFPVCLGCIKNFHLFSSTGQERSPAERPQVRKGCCKANPPRTYIPAMLDSRLCRHPATPEHRGGRIVWQRTTGKHIYHPVLKRGISSGSAGEQACKRNGDPLLLAGQGSRRGGQERELCWLAGQPRGGPAACWLRLGKDTPRSCAPAALGERRPAPALLKQGRKENKGEEQSAKQSQMLLGVKRQDSRQSIGDLRGSSPPRPPGERGQECPPAHKLAH